MIMPELINLSSRIAQKHPQSQHEFPGVPAQGRGVAGGRGQKQERNKERKTVVERKRTRCHRWHTRSM